jgi:hypothetical protein
MEVVIMKKFKKLLSMLLAATMICSINAMPAYAEDESAAGTAAGSTTTKVAGQIKDDNGITTLPFTKVLKTNDAMIITDTTFKFTMVPDTPTETTKEGLTYQAGPALTNPEVELSITSNSINNIKTLTNSSTPGEGEVYVEGLSETSVEGIKLDGSFTLPTSFPNGTGIYRYLVKETEDAKSSATITYDTTQFIVDLWVNKDGKVYVVQSQLYATSDKKPLIFENSLKTSSIRIEKHVNGTKDVPEDTEYKFWIKIPKGGTSIDLAGGTQIKAKKYTPGNTTPETITNITVGGEMTEEQNDATAKNTTDASYGWCSFTLKDGQYLEITGVPAGMVYYLFEEDYQSKGFVTYHQTITGNSIERPADDTFTNNNKGNDASGTTVLGKNGIYYLNTADLPANTGIVLDVMPYVAIVLAAAACALLFISRKKRHIR